MLALVNVRGVKWGGGLQVFITVVKVGSLLAIIIGPVRCCWPSSGSVGRRHRSLAHLRPIWPATWSEVRWLGLGTAFLGV